jgi:hypothetical protein
MRPRHTCVERRRSRGTRLRARAERGQALTELLVSALAMVPLLLALGLLAKYLDLRHAGVSAARYLAFECTVQPDLCAAEDSDGTLAHDVRRRFFDAPSQPIASTDAPADLAAAATGEAFWFDRRHQPLLERFGDVTITLRALSFDAAASAVRSTGERVFPGAAAALADAGPARFGLDPDAGLHAADVSVRVASNRRPLEWVQRLLPIPATMRATTAVLADAWTASGPYGPDPTSVEARIHEGRRLPALEAAIDAAYLPVRGLLTAAAALGLEPAADAFRYRDIDVDRVPPDRLPDDDGASAGRDGTEPPP